MIFASVLYLMIGCVAGFMAGLLGVGGGLIIVPSLFYALHRLGLSNDFSLHMALGTSLATILFTSISSVRAHHKRQSVRWDIFKRLTPGILLGTFIGAQVVGIVPAKPLRIFFIVFLFAIAIQMIFNLKPKAQGHLPGKAGMSFVGGIIGFISSFVGIGGGSISVPFMNWCNVAVRQTIGTSAALGFPIALAGAIGNMVSGLQVQDLPPWSLGYVYLPALGLIVLASMPMATIGAKVAHHLPAAMLKKIFATMLLSMAIYMLISL